jgi:hypothetical protein
MKHIEIQYVNFVEKNLIQQLGLTNTNKRNAPKLLYPVHSKIMAAYIQYVDYTRHEEFWKSDSSKILF